MTAPQRPALASIIHVALTVADVDASVEWYGKVMGLERVTTAPHEGGFGVVLSSPDQRIWIALHHHDGNEGEAFSETRTGLDHVAFQVESYADLEAWQAWLAEQGIRRSEIIDLPDFAAVALVFYDPDGIPLELITSVAGRGEVEV